MEITNGFNGRSAESQYWNYQLINQLINNQLINTKQRGLPKLTFLERGSLLTGSRPGGPSPTPLGAHPAANTN